MAADTESGSSPWSRQSGPNVTLCRLLQEQAFETSQKYKEGKFIIELAHMIKENGWENES